MVDDLVYYPLYKIIEEHTYSTFRHSSRYTTTVLLWYFSETHDQRNRTIKPNQATERNRSRVLKAARGLGASKLKINAVSGTSKLTRRALPAAQTLPTNTVQGRPSPSSRSLSARRCWGEPFGWPVRRGDSLQAALCCRRFPTLVMVRRRAVSSRATSFYQKFFSWFSRHRPPLNLPENAPLYKNIDCLGPLIKAARFTGVMLPSWWTPPNASTRPPSIFPMLRT